MMNRTVGRNLAAGALLLSACLIAADGMAQYTHRAGAMRSAAMRTHAQRYPATAGVTRNVSPRGSTASGSVAGLRTALSAFAADMGRMPTGAEGLNALITRPPGARNWRGPYIAVTNTRAPFADPWGTQYRYFSQPAGPNRYIYTIASNGPDRVPGTADDLQIQF